MTIETIEKRIEGKKKELAKLTAKMARIQKAKASGWEENNPYMYGEDDEKWTARDIEKAEKALEALEADLATAMKKANSRNIAVILEFLEGWKKRVTEYYEKTVAEYGEAEKKYYADLEQYKMNYYDEIKLERENPAEYKRIRAAKRAIQEAFKGTYGFIQSYLISTRGKKIQIDEFSYEYERIYSLDVEKLKKELDEEANRKYDFIIERTVAIVGQITDATNLSVGAKGDLNGYIIGTDGAATVQTIGAGGYNIQCFHYRTLINKRK